MSQYYTSTIPGKFSHLDNLGQVKDEAERLQQGSNDQKYMQIP